MELVIQLLCQGLSVFIGYMLEKSGLLFDCLCKICSIGFKIVNYFFNFDGGKNLYRTLIVFVCDIALVDARIINNDQPKYANSVYGQ